MSKLYSLGFQTGTDLATTLFHNYVGKWCNWGFHIFMHIFFITSILPQIFKVLQDTYIYHLPPDPEVIRLPPLLWKRVRYEIQEYIVERQSGGKTVIGWYHRQFMEAARERYFPPDVRKNLHTDMAEYFQVIVESVILFLY